MKTKIKEREKKPMNNQKKKYEAVEAETVCIEVADILTLSGGGNAGEGGYIEEL